MDKYILFSQDTFKIELQIMDEVVDYYTEICVRLIKGNNIYEILNDNIYFLKNLKDTYIVNVEKFEMDTRIMDEKIGILQNEYYYCMYEDICNEDIILEDEEVWIGEKYCCFSTPEYSTWIYKKNGKIYVRITPMFRYFEEENNSELYLDFVNNYQDIIFSEIPLDQLEKTCLLIEEIYQKAVKLRQ